MGVVSDLLSSSLIFQGDLALMRTRFLTGAPLDHGDWTYEAEIGGIALLAIRALFVYVVDFPEGMGHYIGYRSPTGLGSYDEYPDSFGQLVTFGKLRDGSIVPTGTRRITHQLETISLEVTGLCSVGIHVQPGVSLQLVGAVVPS